MPAILNSIKFASLSPRTASNPFFWREVAPVVFAIIAVKTLILMVDPNPKFFLWDSVTYLQGGLDGTLPRDRSFLYSLLIGAIAVPAHSLHALVIAQSVVGATSAFLVFVILRQLLDIDYGIAFIAAMLVAVDPSQLFYERMVMAETLGSATWLTFIALALSYCRDGRAFWLPLTALAGILAVAFRLNGAITIVIVGALLPMWRMMFQSKRTATDGLPTKRYATLALHLLLSLASTGIVHFGYRNLIHVIDHTPPGYIGTQGLFDLGFAAPMVEAVDFDGTGCDPDILQHFSLPLHDSTNREGQLWREDGLWSAMQRECPEPETAAGVVAHRALSKHPWQIVPMAFTTAAQYFDSAEAHWRMESDLGHKGTMPAEIVNPARERFFLEAGPIPWTDTLTSVAFQNSRWWLTVCFFLLLPMSVWLLIRQRYNKTKIAMRGLALIGLCLFLTQFFFSPIICFRYLHPFPALAIMMVAAIFSRDKRNTA